MSTAPPLYIEIADKITAQIRSGQLRPGAALPSTSQLAEVHDVSPATAYRAVRLLHQRNLVLGRVGKGVFVAEHLPQE